MRGGAEQFIEETERSLHDAIMIVRRAIKNDAVVAGGGAIEMELSKYLRDYSRSIAGKEQLLIGSMARALEIIPRQLCDNAGFDATNILNKLRQRHFQGKKSVITQEPFSLNTLKVTERLFKALFPCQLFFGVSCNIVCDMNNAHVRVVFITSRSLEVVIY